MAAAATHQTTATPSAFSRAQSANHQQNDQLGHAARSVNHPGSVSDQLYDLSQGKIYKARLSKA